MSCQTEVPIKDIADIIGEDFIAKEDGTGTNTTLIEPTIRGEVILNAEAKDSLCESLGPCIDAKLVPLEDDIESAQQDATQAINDAEGAQETAEGAQETADSAQQDATQATNAAVRAQETAERAQETAEGAQETADSAQQDATYAQNTAEQALTTAGAAADRSVVRIDTSEDTRYLVLQDGTKIPFDVSDQPSPPYYEDLRVVGFDVKGDNVVITMLDGTEHDLTRQEFADWLSAQDSSLATDAELQDLADQISSATDTSAIEAQISALDSRLNNIQYDQAKLEVSGSELVLTNDDGSEHRVPLSRLSKLSSATGNAAEIRADGIYVPTASSGNPNAFDSISNNTNNLLTNVSDGLYVTPTSLQEGSNITITGAGTQAQPYTISAELGSGDGIDIEDLSKSAWTPGFDAYYSVYDAYTKTNQFARDFPSFVTSRGSIDMVQPVIKAVLYEITLEVKQETVVRQRALTWNDDVRVLVNGNLAVRLTPYKIIMYTNPQPEGQPTTGTVEYDHTERMQQPIYFTLKQGINKLQYLVTSPDELAARCHFAGDFIDNDNIKFA